VGSKEEFTCNALTLEVVEEDESINVQWLGKSSDRDPGKFITPILSSMLERGGNGNKRIVLDFQKLLYLNSSTITPIIRLLDEARRGSHRITVTYQKATKWQDLSFSALQIFKTRDERIQILGV
jgi:hypothetical protein